MSKALPVPVAYDLSAPLYDGWSWQSFWRAHEYPIIRRALEKESGGGACELSLLDVGCGTGWYLKQLEDVSTEQAGVDLSGGMLAVAGHRLHGILLQADARSLPFPAARFDAVLCTRVLSHLPSIATAVTEMRRVLTDSGMLIVSDVDATHDYERTRLPVAGGHILADTYKHDRAEVSREIEHLGFVRTSIFVIHMSGRAEEFKGLDVSRPVSDVAGWIGMWRKSLSDELS
jgi:ubiquinone/menaquinone biosynthesis C-methylase UbiE